VEIAQAQKLISPMPPSTPAIGLILTVGFRPELLIYTFRQMQVTHAVFIGTNDSFDQSLDAVIEGVGIRPSAYRTQTIADSPGEIGKLCSQFYEAYQWLLERGVHAEHVFSDPTGGRKWMSAGATMASSLLGIKTLYVDALFENGVLIKDSMKLVSLGNAYDQTGFVLAGQGRTAFNRFDFEGAALYFEQINPTLSHKSDLYTSLAGISQNLARWDRFEHYETPISEGFKGSLKIIERALRTGGGSVQLAAFVDVMHLFTTKLAALEGQKTLTIDFIADLYLNAQRCIHRNRYDDAIARLYRTLESVSQYLLQTSHAIDPEKPDYQALAPDQLEAFRLQCRGGILPSKLDLCTSMRLLDALGNAAADHFFAPDKKRSFRFEGLLSERNRSILAHGLKPIARITAEKFSVKISELLHALFGEVYLDAQQHLQTPQLPTLGF